MPRGIPWDDLTLFRGGKSNEENSVQPAPSEPTTDPLIEQHQPRNYQKDAEKIGRRMLFGFLVRI
jgi:hypothetical protein